MAIWVLKDGQREGPYEEQDVRELIYEGTYTDVDPAIQDGQLDWTTIGQLLGRVQASTEPLVTPEAAPPSVPQELQTPAAPPPVAEAAPILVETALANAEFPPVQGPIQVTVVDFQMPLGSMIAFLFKWMVAAIIVAIILGLIAGIFWVGFFAAVAALLHH